MKIYTKFGDHGETSLIGQTASKADLRIEAYGCIDELLAFTGDLLHEPNLPSKIRNELMIIIDKLFDLNRSLATPSETNYLKDNDINLLENAIDYMQTKLQPLTHFILPIGDQVFTKLNIIRTLVRRAERRSVALAQDQMIDPLIIPYLNRLSDYFFVAMRYSNYCNNKPENTKYFH